MAVRRKHATYGVDDRGRRCYAADRKPQPRCRRRLVEPPLNFSVVCHCAIVCRLIFVTYCQPASWVGLGQDPALWIGEGQEYGVGSSLKTDTARPSLKFRRCIPLNARCMS